jgi:hypothetical protein
MWVQLTTKSKAFVVDKVPTGAYAIGKRDSPLGIEASPGKPLVVSEHCGARRN